ncbi:MAG TPA: carboxylesterase family protein, partial [Burkholderiales bacterium]
MTASPSRTSLTRRHLLKSSALLAGAGFASALLPRAARAAEPVVETTLGKIRGSTDDGVHVFKGVRYGGDTGGANRFRPTPPAKKWAGVLDATEWPRSAPQDAQTQEPFYAWYTQVQPQSEDCLFVNVFTRALSDHKKRPVMVWYHGGAWGSCAGSAPGFNGTSLARNEDVVVVTVNHRLNVFGYVQLDDHAARFADSGNAGVLDMVASLKWVRDNIARFGGDPHNVTIFGQSGGAAKVIALMGLPAAKGLFHKAIVESCSGGMRIASQEEATVQGHDLAKLLGVERLTGEALQNVPMQTLVAAQKKIADPFRPVVDGRSFKRDPFYPEAPAWSAHVPLMIGNANTETSYYIRADKKNFSIDMETVKRRLKKFLRV